MISKPFHFLSADGRFELCLPGKLMDQLLDRCSTSGSCETGGILVGKYSENQCIAEVTAISDSPSDSVASCMGFIRGVRGLCRWLKKLWRGNSQYYLGEWHYHPGSSSQPSGLDKGTMEAIANAEMYKCPEPILLIIGGSEDHGWLFHAQVTKSDGTIIELYQNA